MTARREPAIALGLAFLALTLGLAFQEPELAPWGDNAEFMVLAKSLASGQGLRDISRPDSPVHRKYPAGFPLMLAAVERVSPGSVGCMRALVLAHFVLSVVLLYWLLLLWDWPRLAAPVTVLFCTSALVLQFVTDVMSEIPYLCFSLLALLLHELQERAGARPAGRWLFAGAAAASVWATLVRSVGITLVGALCLRLAIKRRFARAAALAAVAAATLATQSLLRGSGSDDYTQAYRLVDYYDLSKGAVGLGEFVQRVFSNLAKYGLDLIPGSLLPVQGQRPLLLCMALLVAAGLLALLRRWHVAALYFGGMLVPLLAWPRIWAVPRYVVPLVPFTALLATIALVAGWDWMRGFAAARLRRSPPAWVGRAAMASLVVVLCSVNFVDALRLPAASDPRWLQYLRAMDWLRVNAPPSAVVMCRKPHTGYLRSGRRTVGVTRRAGESPFFEEMTRFGVSLVVVDSLPLPGIREIVIPGIQKHRDRFEPVYQAGRPPLWIFRFMGNRGGP
jgi:hypothetical protein